MPTVHTYSKLATEFGVPAKFIGTPFLINEDGVFEPIFSKYFLARRNGDYIPGEASGTAVELEGMTATQCDIGYLRNRAYQLDVYRRWCRSKGIDPVHVDASELERFARDHEKGKVTATSDLVPDSVNQTLRSIIDFLSYCVATGRRARLALPFKKFKSTRYWSRQAYIVMRRVNPREITYWYTEDELDHFLNAFDKSHYKLGAEIIFATGLRLSELLGLRLDTFPTPEMWRSSRKHRYIKVRGKYRKLRLVEVELDIVEKVHAFLKTQRKKNLRLWGKSSQLLLIGEHGPVRHRMFQRAVSSAAKESGCHGLTPHLLRHHYAAHFLLRAWKQQKPRTNFQIDFGVAVLSHELIRLQKNLGHSNPATTMKYLYALGVLAGADISDSLRRELDNDR